ncbi:helix-turn-helix domain-containing protein [Dysgonomonas sp. BGC7]|uniref:helix-turn-helix domain-containing protein n=2 Tax=Dysgonomonas sp. BGC7 TaxID=1658008 RepID=UPI000A507F99
MKYYSYMTDLLFSQKVDEETLDQLESFLNQISSLCDKHNDKSLNEWLDAQDVCEILNIQPRTLQTYRNNGKIGFSQIDRKIFYKPCDVQKILNSNNSNSKKQRHV